VDATRRAHSRTSRRGRRAEERDTFWPRTATEEHHIGVPFDFLTREADQVLEGFYNLIFVEGGAQLGSGAGVGKAFNSSVSTSVPSRSKTNAQIMPAAPSWGQDALLLKTSREGRMSLGVRPSLHSPSPLRPLLSDLSLAR
jgi:hypothetical protein